MVTNIPNQTGAQAGNGQNGACNGVADSAESVALSNGHNPLKNNDCSGVAVPAGDEGNDGTNFEAAMLHGLLTRITGIIETYMVLPPHAASAAALWIVHTYTHDAHECSPRLVLFVAGSGMRKD